MPSFRITGCLLLRSGAKKTGSLKEVSGVTLIAALSHAVSTVIIGIILGFVGKEMAEHIAHFTHFIAPSILILLGFYFIYRHHQHKHFSLSGGAVKKHSKAAIITALAVAMFFSPCMEIEAYFLLAGTYGKWLVWCMALLYVVITTTGMIVFVRFAYRAC